MSDALPIVLQQIDLDIVPGKNPQIVHVSEYDTGRNIVVNLFRDGHPFGSNSIESYTVKVEGSIGKYGFSENAAWADDAEGVVVIHLTEAMTAIHGRVWTKIKLIKSESMQISTCGFWMDVDRAGVNAQDVIQAKGFTEQIAAAAGAWLEDQGFTSPTVDVTEITGGHRVTVTDYEGSESFDVMDGEDTGVMVDPTLSVEGAAADAKVTGNEIAKLENKIDDIQSGVFKTRTKTGSASIVLQAGEGIPATTKLLQFRVPANTPFSFRLDFGSGVSQIDAVYKIDINEARSAIWYEPTSGRVYTRTADTEITFFSVFIRGVSVSTETTVTMTVWYAVENEGSLEERIDETDERIDEAEESIENLNNLKLNDPYFEYNNDFVIGSASTSTSTDPTRAKTKPILGRGVLTVKNALSSGYNMGVKVWSDAPYGTLLYDSSWKATNDFSYDVTGKYYVVSFCIRPDGTSNIDLTALANSDIKITEMSQDDTNIVVRLVADVSAIDERIDEAEESLENLNNLKLNDPYFEYNNDFVIGSASTSTSTDPTRAKTKPILGRGVLTVKNALSSGYIMGVKVWSDAPYGTLLYDSSWKATNDFSYDVTGKYYVVSFYIRPDGTSNIDLTALANSDIKITEMSPDDTNIVVRLVADVSAVNETLSDKVGYADIQSETVRTIAHRGDDVVAPQCTAPAYIAARKRGIMTAENDLTLSEDGQFVMWHDGDLSRFGNLVDINGYQMYTDGTNYYYVNNNSVYTWNGSQYVASSVALSSLTRCAGANYSVNSANGKIGLNLDVLKRIDFGRYKGARFVGTQILTFAEWVLLCKQLGMELYIDKKITLTDSLAQSAVTTVKRLGMAEKASWINVGPAEVARIRTHDANARCCALMHPTSSLVEEYAPLNVGRGFFFNCNAKTMTREEVQIGLDAGFEVEAWYVDVTNVPEEQQLEVVRTSLSYGVTAMSLDHIKVEDAFAYLLQ